MIYPYSPLTILVVNMDTVELLESYTKLKPGQRKVLSKLIDQYEESETLLYEVCGQLNSGTKYSVVKENILKEKFLWKSNSFAELKRNRKLRDKMIEEPPEVREGEMACPKCGLKKTLVVEMQTRSADEGFTYYIHCFNPKCKAITK